MLSLEASFESLSCHTRDITQVYTQSAKCLQREVYIRRPAKMGIAPRKVLKVVRPLYGIPELGLHWYLTYMEHHSGRLGLCRSRANHCLLYKHRDGELESLLIFHVNHTPIAQTQSFLNKGNLKSKSSMSRPTRKPLNDRPIFINILQITFHQSRETSIRQQTKIQAATVSMTEREFKSKRALIQYIDDNCRADVCTPVQLIAPRNETIKKCNLSCLGELSNTSRRVLTGTGFRENRYKVRSSQGFL